jgi:hypothetical protein
MDSNLRTGGLIAGGVLFVFLMGSMTLHFCQKAHNRLDLDLEAEFPPEEDHLPGEILATVLARIVEHELDSPFGWRPNDFFPWGPALWADNNASRQLGIMHGIRETMLVFKDNLTKVSANVYDRDLVEADTMFRNDEKKLFFPSAENRFSKGVTYLEHYIHGLHTDPPTSRPLNRRTIECIKLFEAWTTLLGDGHGNLYREHERDGSPVRCWKTDNYFYAAQGYAHVMYYVMQAIRREYGEDLGGNVEFLFDEVLDALYKAHTLKPLIILDGSPTGFLANHRGNLDSYISEARDKMFSIKEELEKK